MITLEPAEQGVGQARRKLGQLVHEPALADLSNVDRTFLAHMALDDGPSLIRELAARMDMSNQQAFNYRRGLLDAEMIVEAGRGKVDFALPFMRDYLREHIVTDVMDAK